MQGNYNSELWESIRPILDNTTIYVDEAMEEFVSQTISDMLWTDFNVWNVKSLRKATKCSRIKDSESVVLITSSFDLSFISDMLISRNYSSCTIITTNAHLEGEFKHISEVIESFLQ